MLALLFAAALAGAPDAVLWRDITAGMSESSLRERYPEAKGSVTYHKDWLGLKDAFTIGICHPFVEIDFKGGGVRAVSIWSRPRGILLQTCGDDVQTALTGKYGQPATQATDTKAGLGVPNRTLHYTWKSGDTIIDFVRDDMDAQDTWSISYKLALTADI